jgi:hypothetical protein
MSVWGVLLWANITPECFEYYSVYYLGLLILFYIDVVLLVVGVVVCLLLIILVFGSLGVMVLQTKTT